MSEHIKELQEAAVFKALTEEDLKDIYHHFSYKIFDEGLELPAKEILPMLVNTVIDGEISVYDETGDVKLISLKDGDVFGEMAATPCLPEAGTLRFTKDTKVLCLSIFALEDMSTHHQRIALNIFRNLLGKAYERIADLHCGMCETRQKLAS